MTVVVRSGSPVTVRVGNPAAESVVAGYVGTGGTLDDALDARYGARARQRALRAVSKIAPAGAEPYPAVTTDTPTVTWSSSETVSGNVAGVLDERVRVLGRQGSWNATFGYLDVGAFYTGLEFILNGDTVEFGFTEQTSNDSRFWMWVDDEPVTAAPITVGTTTSAGSNYWCKLAFGSSKRRKVTIYISRAKALIDVRTPATATISSAPARGLLAVVGDSFASGSSGTTDLSAIGPMLARLLGMDYTSGASGGTGYVAGAETFGSAGRIAKITERAPDLVVVLGSVNDDGQAGVQAAAEAAYTAIAAACPGVPLIVFGPQPTNAASTLSANRIANNKAVKAATAASSSVTAFHDMIGGVDEVSLSAWSSGTTYSHGDIVTHKGSVWQLNNPGGTSLNQAPSGQKRWNLLTYAYIGTGQVGATVGDGNRDTLVYSDGVHPTVDGTAALAQRIESDVRADIAALTA